MQTGFKLRQADILEKMPEGLARDRLEKMGEYKYEKYAEKLELNQNGLDWKVSPKGA